MQSISCASTRAPSFPPFCKPETPVLSSRFDENGPLYESLREPETAAAGVGAAPADTAPGAAAAGLVSSQTSGTSRTRVKWDGSCPDGSIRVDRHESRLKRLRCTVLTAARLHVQQKTRWKVAMLTLTYDMKRCKWEPGQISAVVRHIRQWLARKGHEMRFVWVMEFQKNGNPHYHLLVWLPLGLRVPMPDKRGWWPYGFTRFEWARNAVGYIAKYASKGDSLHQPEKGARMHGNGGLTEGALIEQRWWKLPSWLRDRVEPSDGVRRAPPRTGGGFVHPDTGEVYRSPWEVSFFRGHVFIRLKEGV